MGSREGRQRGSSSGDGDRRRRDGGSGSGEGKRWNRDGGSWNDGKLKKTKFMQQEDETLMQMDHT
ncbi:hypothetical protein KI387_040906, partial [Taxus chinensis]